MKLSEISFRNVGPFGNKLQTIKFDKKGALWMVVGRVGAGKSYLVNLPKILYYGKLDRLKRDDISNRLNKHAYIRGVDEISPSNTVVIERYISPSKLSVEKNGEDIGKAGITDYQSYIDAEVTGLPYHIFSNIISLSINDFKSFVSMTPGDKRIIIDKLFAMESINRMTSLIKRDLRDTKMSIELFDREIMSFKNNIDVAVKELQKLKESISNDNTLQLAQLSAKLNEFKPKLKDAYQKKEVYETKRDEINKSYRVFQVKCDNIHREISDIQKKLHLFEKDMCPTCETPFADSRFDLIRDQLQEDIKIKEARIKEVKEDEKKYTHTLKQINDALRTINDFIIKVQSTINSIQSEINRLNIDKPDEFKSIQNIITSNTKSLKKRDIDKSKYDDEYKYLNILEQLYSDSGVKKKILESYLPTLNREIAFTLNELHFPYTLTFNSDFEPQINHLGIDISVETLSTGEKKSIDIAVLISIIRMMKRKYHGLNIFMLDEVLSSLDNDKIHDVIGVLKNTAKELNLNIFIINHSVLPIEYFDYKVTIEKNAGFSDMVIEKLESED